MLLLTIQNSTLGQHFQVFISPAKLYPHLRAESHTIIQHAIVVVDERTNSQHHAHTKRSVIILGTILKAKHLISLTSQSTQRQVSHHDDGPRRLILLKSGLLYYAFPVELVDVVFHSQLMMEILVLEPEMGHSCGNC